MADKITKLAFEISNIKAQLRARATAPQLGNSSLENRALNQYDGAGNLGAQFGVLPDGTNGAGSFTGPNPPQPSQPSCSTIPGLIEARWNGLFVDALSPLDLRHVAVYVVPDGGTIDLAHAAGTVSGELGDAASVQMPIGTYQVYFVAWSLSGKWSVPSAPTTVVVPTAVDAASVQDALDDLNAKTDGLLTTAGQLDTRLDTAETDLTAHETRLDTAETDLTTLQDTTLPALDADLQAAKGRLTTAESDIDAAQGSLATAQTDLNTLKNTTVPNLNTDLQAAKARLTTAEGDIDAAETKINTDLPASIAAVQAAADMALLIAPVSTATPLVGDGAGRPVNAVWTRIDGSGNEIGYWRWTGTAWVAQALTTTVIPNLAASKITTGTLATARLDAASIAVAIASIIQLNADRITAGQLTSAQINTTDLAAAIATIISLNADRITAGTINTARLNVTELSTQIASIISLNASRITAGTIATARLDVSALAASIATIINLNADRITAGTIATARLNAVEIAAATANFQTADIKNLFVTTGTFTEAVINKIYADAVISRKLAAQYVAIGDFTNLIGDPVELGSAGTRGWASGLTLDTVDVPSEFTYAVKSAPSQGTYGIPSPLEFQDIDPGENLVFSFWIKADKPGSRYYQEIRDQDGAHAATWTALPGKLAAATLGAYPFGNTEVPTVWTKYWAVGTASATAKKVRIGSMYFNHPNGTERTAQVWVSGVTVRRRVKGELIVDGSITATSLAADAINGKVITGATFQTDAAAGVGIKIDTAGFRAYGPNGGNPVTEIRTDGGTVYSVTDPVTGDALATLGSDGTISGSGLNVENDPIIMGNPLIGSLASWESPTTTEPTGLLDMVGRGIVARGSRNYQGDVIPAGEKACYELSFIRYPGRTYLVTVSNMSIYGEPQATISLFARITYDGTRPRLTDTLIWRSASRSNDGGATRELHNLGGSFIVTAGAQAVTRMIFSISVTAGDAVVQDTATGGSLEVYIMDIGMTVDWTDVARTDQIITGGTTTAPTPPPEKKNYTKVYAPTDHRSYTGSGATYTISGSEPAKMYQGQSPYGPTGITSSIATFPSMTGDLSGATITSIRIYFYFDFWYYNSGGTADVMLHGQSSTPSTKPTLTNCRNVTGWPKPGGMWVSVGSSFYAGFKSGAYKGVGLGDGTSGFTHYGYANWSKTRIEIKYTK